MALTGIPVDTPLREEPPDDAKWRKYTLYATMQRAIFDECGARITFRAAQLAFEAVVAVLFRRVVDVGWLRFPHGYGSLKLAKSRYVPNKQMPTGAIVQVQPNKVKMKFTAGVATHEMLGTNVQKYRRKTPRRVPPTPPPTTDLE